MLASHESFRLRIVRLHELFLSARARAGLSHRILLGDPQHSLARCSWAKTEVRLARDGHGYTLREFEEEHGEWATWCWERSTVLHPISTYKWLREQDKQACHRALLRILRKQNDVLIGRKVLTDPRAVHVLPEDVKQLIASFITIDKEAVKAMTYMKRTLFLENKSMGKGLTTAPLTARDTASGVPSATRGNMS